MFLSVTEAKLMRPRLEPRLRLPLILSRVPAGFPSPGDDFADSTLDLNELISHPAATFFIRVLGQSMERAGIGDGDLLVVDRSREARHGNIVIAVVGGDMTVKRLERREGSWWLVPAHPAYRAFPMGEDAEVWGVVAHTIKTHP